MFPFADLIGPLPIVFCLILAAALATGLRWREQDGAYFSIVTIALTGAIWFVRAHEGANVNATIPLYAWLAVLGGVALHRLLTRFAAAPNAPAFLWLLALAQLASHLYRPAEIRTGNLAARQTFLAALKATPGDVWVVDHSYDAILAGKPLHADMDALDAVLGRGYPPALAQFHTLTGNAQLTAVVLDRTPESYQPKGLFTAPPLSNVYRLRALTPGANAPGELDEPQYTLLPCTPTQVPNSLTDLRTAYINTSICPQP